MRSSTPLAGTGMLSIPYPAKPYTAVKKIEDGNPVLYINGVKTAPMIYALSDIPASNPLTAQAQRNIANFAAHGVHILSPDVDLSKGWRKNEPYDPDFLFGELSAIVETDPDACLLLRLHTNPPYWWLRDNPDELCIYGSGGCDYEDHGNGDRLIRGDESNHMRASLASEKWKKEAGEAIVSLLRAIKDTPQGQHIIGIQIAGGVYGEWHQWGLWSNNPDYGKPQTALFRRYLQEIYPDENALQEAWKDNTASFGSARQAPVDMRDCSEAYPFRDPQKDKYVVDSLKALMKAAPDAIMYFSDVIRSCWDRDLILGCFYGYFDSWDQMYVSGKFDLQRLSESGKVDFFAAPFRYDPVLRGADGVTSARGLLESTRLNGLLWLTEMDDAPIGSTEQVGGTPERRAESIAILRRDILEPTVQGMGSWFYDHRLVLGAGMGCSIYYKKGWWDHPDMLREISLLKRIADRCAARPYRSEADVLLVFDTESVYYALGHGAFSLTNERAFYMSLGKSGAVYDAVYLHDLPKAELGRYKLVIFVNTYFVTAKMRRFIREKVASDGRTLLWIHADGLIDESSNDLSNIGSLCRIGVEKAQSDGRMEITGFPVPIQAPVPYTVLYAVKDPDAVPLARFCDSGAVAGAVKKAEDHTDIYFSVFPSDRKVLRKLFSDASVRLISDTDATVMYGNGIAVITVVSDQTIHLNLENGRVIDEKLPAMTTAVYDIYSGERLDQTMKDL